MSDTMYDWKRFWIPAGKKSELLGTSLFRSDGFLPDPDIDFVYRDKKPQTLDTYRDKHCLVMLGEMGIGKTTELEKENAALKKEGKTTLYVKGIQINDKNELRRKTEETDTFRTWQNSSGDLYLFIDGFDEALLRNEAFAHDLLELLEDHREHAERLYLRITSRPFDWHNEMAGETFAGMWESNAFEVIKLCILRHRDVALTLSKNGLKESDFFKGVTRLKIGYLASQPITLKLLLAEYSRNQKLSSSKVDIFNHGTLRLCEDENPNRQKLRSHRNTMPAEDAQRFAGSLAMLGIFSRRPLIYTGKASTYRCDTDLEHANIHATGTLIQNYLNTSSANVQAAIETSLFEGLGDYLFTWKHRSYAEFLAAKAIVDSRINPEQIRQLIVSHVDNAGTERIVPELRDMVSWLVSMNSDYLHMVKNIDPELCINADLSDADDATKLEIAKAFLDKIEAFEISAPKWGTWYHQLKCSGLSNVLKTYIPNKAFASDTRYIAIEIAHDCECYNLSNGLLEITLDSTEDVLIRKFAARAVCSLYPEGHTQDLLPLLEIPTEEDPYDDIFQTGINRLWRKEIDTWEVLSYIENHESRENFIGSYAIFCSDYLPKGLNDDELPGAIVWATNKLLYGLGPKQRAAEGIIKKGFENIEDNRVTNALAWTFLCVCQEYRVEDFFECDETRMLDNCTVRHGLYEMALEHAMFMAPAHVRMGPIPENLWNQWGADDIKWILEALQELNEESQKRFLVNLLLPYLYNIDPANLNMEFICLNLQNLALKDSDFQVPFEVMKKKRANLGTEAAKETNDKTANAGHDWKSILNALQDPRISETEYWDWLYRRICFVTRNAHRDVSYDETQLDIIEKNLPPALMRLFLDSAKAYIKANQPDLAIPNTYNNNKGKQAVILLWHAEQKWLKGNHNILIRWVPALLYTWETGDEYLSEEILPYLEKECDDDFLKAVSDSFLANTMQGEPDFAWINILLDINVKSIVKDNILPFLKEPKSRKNIENFRVLLDIAVKQGERLAIEYAKELLENHKEYPDTAVCAAQALVKYQMELTFDDVLNVFETSPEIGKDVLAYKRGGGQIREIGNMYHGKDMAPMQIARMIVWLNSQYPRIEEYIGIQDVKDVRDNLVRAIEKMASFDAISALDFLISKCPQNDWYKRIRAGIYSNIAAVKYEPQSPEKLIELFEKPERRLVRDEREMQDVLLLALEDLQGKLFNSLERLIPDFYSDLKKDKDGKKKSRGTYKYPKQEEEFSRVICNNLRDALKGRNITLTAESHANSNDRIDILLSSTDGDNYFNVIVESKCCWNLESRKDKMEEQLAGKYMKFGATTPYGLFLVGWYGCKKCQKEGDGTCIAKRISFKGLGDKVKQQAQDINIKHSINIVPFVIDVSLKSESLNE